jgi:hypothetical protein
MILFILESLGYVMLSILCVYLMLRGIQNLIAPSSTPLFEEISTVFTEKNSVSSYLISGVMLAVISLYLVKNQPTRPAKVEACIEIENLSQLNSSTKEAWIAKDYEQVSETFYLTLPKK